MHDFELLKFECTNNDAEYEATVLNTWRTNATNEQSILGTYHDLKMANLSASYTPQQWKIIDRLTKQYQDGSARVDDDLSTHYTWAIQHEIPGKGGDKPLQQRPGNTYMLFSLLL